MYTIAEAKKSIMNGIKGYLAKKDNGEYVMKEVNRLPFYLEGEPGIGKTEIVKQIAEEMGLGYVSFSLVHHTRNSLLGLPVIKELENGDKYTSYTMSEIIAKVQEAVEEGHKEGILLLDEFPCMSETIMPAMLAFLQTKNIGTHHLPEGWVIVLCGNPQEYNKTSRMFDAAIVDRIRKLEIQFEPRVFLNYGEQIGLHGCILDYLEENPARAYHYEKDKGKMKLVTCRGWENLSYMLKAYEEMELEITSEDVKQYLKYETVAVDFVQYYAQYTMGLRKPDIKNILGGTNHPQYVKMLKNTGINKKWRSVKSIMIELKNRCKENNKELQDEKQKLMKSLENMLVFAEKIDTENALLEMLFCAINKEEDMLHLLKENPNKQYLKICKKWYGAIA